MIFIVVQSILVLISLVGNTLVILTVLINKPMQTTLNYLLVNLVVADMMFALFIGIEYVTTPFLTHPEGKAGQYLCKFVTNGTMAWVGGAVSILCLVYIAIERYFAIIHPLRQRGRFTRRRLKVFIVLGWSFAMLMNMPDFVETRYYQPDLRSCTSDNSLGDVGSKVKSLVWMVLAGIVPVSIMVYLYSRVVHRLWFLPVENMGASQRAAIRYRQQVTITLIMVSVIYAVCWIPNLITHLMESGWGEVITWFDETGTALLTFNSCVNPVLYSMRMKTFRKHLRYMLLCKKRQTVRGQAAVVSVGSTTGQPISGSEGSTRNTAAPTPFSFPLAFKKEMVTTEASLNVAKYRRESLIMSLTTVDIGNIEKTTCTTVTGSNSSSSLQNIMNILETSNEFDTVETLKTIRSPESRNKNTETWTTAINTATAKKTEAVEMFIPSPPLTESTATGTATTSPGTSASSRNLFIGSHCDGTYTTKL